MTKNIYLKRKLIEATDYDAVLVAVYTALRSLYTTTEAAVVCVSVNTLCFELLGHLQISRTFRENMQKGLEKFLKLEIITLVEHKGKDYVLDLSNLQIGNVKEATKEKEYYISVESQELHKIYNSNTRMDKFSLARLFMVMIASIDFNAKVSDPSDRLVVKSNFTGYMPQSFLASKAQIAPSSCVSYFAELERLELVYIHRHPICIMSDGKIKKLNNNYGRHRDHELINAYVGVIQDMHYGGTQEQRAKAKQANYSRSMSQKYNCLRNGVQYSVSELAEIKTFVEKKNRELHQMIENTNDQYEKMRLESRLKDVTIFDNLNTKISSSTKIIKETVTQRKYHEFCWKEKQAIYDEYCDFTGESTLADKYNTTVAVIEQIVNEFNNKVLLG